MSISKVKDWANQNKSLMFFVAASLCLLASTVGLAVSKCGSHCEQEEKNIDIMAPLLTSELTELNTTQSANNETVALIDPNYYRLSRNVVPKSYALNLMPIKRSKLFNGSVTIIIEVQKPTQKISLHSKKLKIFVVTLHTMSNKHIPIASKKGTLDKRELLEIQLHEEIQEGQYKLFLKYAGRLDNGIVGLYASKLKDGSIVRTDLVPVLMSWISAPIPLNHFFLTRLSRRNLETKDTIMNTNDFRTVR